MSIIASAKVPAGSRLIDADTVVIPRPRLELVTAPCPTWCERDHSGEQVEVDGFLLGTVHERIVTEVTAADPATYSDAATATVLVERSDEDGAVITPARVVLTVAEGDQGDRAGGEGVQGWTGTPEQAEALAAALLAAARTVRAAR